jgi:hypothetical protein
MTTAPIHEMPDAPIASGAAEGTPQEGGPLGGVPALAHRTVPGWVPDLVLVLVLGALGFLATMAAYWVLVAVVEPALEAWGIW